MNLLAFELATERCSVALLVHGELRQRADEGTRPSRQILGMAHELLQQANLPVTAMDAIAFGRGPGAFTGLRIAAGVVQGLAFGADLPVVPVSSLAALAQRAAEDHAATQVLTLLDARMNEVYAGAYRIGVNGLVRPIGDELLLPPGDLELPAPAERAEWVAAGPGWSAYPELVNNADLFGAVFPRLRPDAAAVARLATVQFAEQGGVDAAEAIPVYLRDTVAWQKSGA